MVRLKAQERADAMYPQAWFQFHNGSIKRESMSKLVAVPEQFQFHNGSIKRELIRAGIQPSTRFNSTMVRLKERK